MPALEIKHLSAGYGQTVVISNISLTLEKGEWFVLLGPNGTGKSTLLRCVGGRIKPTTGTIHINGSNLHRDSDVARSKLGFGVQPEQLPGLLTGRQCLEVYAMAQQLPAIDEDVLRLCHAFRLEAALDSFTDTWSLGMRQKLAVLLSLLGDPALVVLDEAFNGLDPRSASLLRSELGARVKSRRCAVLLATHHLDLVAQVATGAGLLVDGRLVQRWESDVFAALKVSGTQAIQQALEAAYAD